MLIDVVSEDYIIAIISINVIGFFMARSEFFLLVFFSCVLISMEQPEPKWHAMVNWQEMEPCQELIIVYKPRIKLGETARNVLSESCNYAYVVPHLHLFTELVSTSITKVPMKISINKKSYLIMATLSDCCFNSFSEC